MVLRSMNGNKLGLLGFLGTVGFLRIQNRYSSGRQLEKSLVLQLRVPSATAKT